MKNTETIINKFPKTRVPLAKEYADIYESHYRINREGETTATSMAQKMETWLHKKVAEDLTEDSELKTLEIGAGTLNQLQYEPKTIYDVIEPFSKLYKGSPYLDRINSIYNDISEITGNKYDRITSIASFEHIDDLPYVVAKSCLLLKNDGCLRVAIPNEGTILWKLGWMFTTGLEYKFKYKLKYSTLLNHEHINDASEIEAVLSYFYNSVKCKVFGLSKGFAFYRFYECKEPKTNIAEQYLKNYNHKK